MLEIVGGIKQKYHRELADSVLEVSESDNNQIVEWIEKAKRMRNKALKNKKS